MFTSLSPPLHRGDLHGWSRGTSNGDCEETRSHHDSKSDRGRTVPAETGVIEVDSIQIPLGSIGCGMWCETRTKVYNLSDPLT